MALPVLTIAQMREWEQASWAAGRNEIEVIRRVGKAVAQKALQLTRPDEIILILAGKGHNGEDARSAREHLAERRVDLLNVGDPTADLSKLHSLLSLKPALVIDGLFGIGLNRPLGAEWIGFIQQINESRARVLAVDVPSGLNADTGQPQGAAVQALMTLTVGAPKVGLLQESSLAFTGRLEVADSVGLIPCPIASELQWTMPDDFHNYPPPRPVDTHKGNHGHVAILAGSMGYHGAAVLAARGAQRAQPGLITLFTLESVYHVVASQLQSVMVSTWPADSKMPGPWSVILAGPGLASREIGDPIRLMVRFLWRDSKLPIIADASALDWLPLELTPRNVIRVITPHPGEAARLLRCSPQQVQADRLGALRKISKRLNDAWVVLKGHQTLIGRSAGNVYVNSSGNQQMAQGGSGDVLAGYLAGHIGQPALGADPMQALRFAVWQHGAAADRLQARQPGWIIEELAAELSKNG